MATETSSTLLSPEAFLKVYIPPRCPSVNSPIVSLRPKSDRPDSQQLCLWRWPAHHTESYDDLDMLFRCYRYHTVPDDSPTIRMDSGFDVKYIEPTIQLVNNEFLTDEAPALRCEIDSNNSGYGVAKVVSNDCPRIPPSTNDSTLSSNKCRLVVLFIDPAIAIDWRIFEPMGKKTSFTPDNIARPFFDLLVSECNRVGSQYGILTDERHMSIIYFPPDGPPDLYRRLDLNYNYNFFVRNLSVADSPLRWTIAACVLFSVGASSLKPVREFDLCQGVLRDPACLNDSFSTEPEILQSFRSYRDFDLYTLQRSPAAWHQFVCWRTWAQRQAVKPQTRIKQGSVLRVQCNGFLRNYRPWRSPFPNPRPPQETLDIVTRYPRPRDVAVDEAIARASQINNNLSFEVVDVKRAGPDYFSQVFFGKLEGTNTAICVKLFDERLFPCSQQLEYGEGVEPELQLLNLNFADDMMRREEGVYCDRLQYLQGFMIPHCYGFHVFTLPDGWEVLGFFMEAIDGPSLWEIGQQNQSPDFQASVVTGVRHMVRALGFAGVDQRDWHLDQILCPGNPSVTIPPQDDARVQSNSDISTHLPMVLIDFAFAPQKLGEDWSRPGYPVHNPSVVKLTLYDEIGVPYDVISDHWLPMMEEEY